MLGIIKYVPNVIKKAGAVVGFLVGTAVDCLRGKSLK